MDKFRIDAALTRALPDGPGFSADEFLVTADRRGSGYLLDLCCIYIKLKRHRFVCVSACMHTEGHVNISFM